MAALPELWHICVFIEAGGMELGKLGGGCGGKCVCMVVCVRGSVRLGWGGGVIARPSCSVCVCVCVGGFWQEFGQREGGQKDMKGGEKGGSCRSGCIYRSVVKRSHLRGMRPFLHCDRRGACLKRKRQL